MKHWLNEGREILNRPLFKNKKTPDLLKGRTKEWNSEDWQGRSRDQVESTYKLTTFLVIACFMAWVVFIIYNLVT